MSEPVEASPARALVAGHADFAAGLVSAVELICGRGDALVPIQVRGLCGADIEDLLRQTLERTGARVIFTDLQAGSCTMAARRVQRQMPGVVLVAGANLPMLLDFALSGEAEPGAAALAAAEKGRGAVNVFGGHAVTLVLNRIDDRLIHGQVVVGWGQPLDVRFIVLVDDAVAESDWEQDLYRMAVPPEMEVRFHGAADAVRHLDAYRRQAEPGILVTGDIDTMRTLVASGHVRDVNVGGIHHRAGRVQHLRYVFLTPAEQEGLRGLATLGAVVTAQDVPAARAVPLEELLASREVA